MAESVPVVDPGMQMSELSEDSDVVYIPECSNHMKPHVGRKFRTLDEGEKCYRLYGAVCGFDIRLNTIRRSKDGTIIWRYITCNREGERSVEADVSHDEHGSSKTKRRRMSCRSSCMARVVFRFCPVDGYVVKELNEAYTHPLVSDCFKQFMKSSRKLDYAHQNFILNCAKANIGPMRSFRLFKELVGTYDNVGCSGLEFKNFTRDLRTFVVGVDAQILLNKFKNKRETCSGFTFDYSVDSGNKLERLFWADPLSIKNYQIFGDVVSFDATYSTNRYNMVFTPFTGKDNQGKCVTFAAGLLNKENVESYSWLFQKFKECMGTTPKMFITDQDLAMKIAIAEVMPDTRHRFCMWHIMLKVADKIPNALLDDEEFTKKFNGIVWSEYIEKADFEEQWFQVMDEFGLLEHKWFCNIFDLRNHWIPAYFRDFPMGGLFRTTSLSESENSFFRKFFNSSSNLCAFFMQFGSAMDSQRHTHAQLSSIDESQFPIMQTKLPIERHAASVYSNKIFRCVQEEMVAAFQVCCMVNIEGGDDMTVYEVDDNVDGIFKVTHNASDDSVSCGCNKFITKGLLCRHIFLVFKNMKVKSIPEKYIVKRWRKFAYSTEDGYTYNPSASYHGPCSSMNKQVISEVYKCVGFVDGNSDLMEQLLVDLRCLSDKYGGLATKSSDGGKQKLFEDYYGSTIPDTIDVLPPDPVKTKGSGSRIKSRKEKAFKQMNKPKRRCRSCNQMTNHDSRNCPVAANKNST